MGALTLTFLSGIAILALAWLLTVLLYWRWFVVSKQAMIMALTAEDITQRKLDKMLARLRRLANAIKLMRLICREIPVLLPILVVGLVISWFV